ncbi:nucleotide exchange factor GrpE [Candidatus Vallotiella sp. (ex Adelges kitamiensis)]|uniref:nucleotide exchange factor GrpE n=1 Tax=Candidatus Vallotiella sp. (ex Adelges kitamiensis) TaxID=2864217 RepID=UPI001CE38807|nr:nucleotide exchange factor GrpE [Candidatus Vallotia sp. (ex Adelges kitamiensis)]
MEEKQVGQNFPTSDTEPTGNDSQSSGASHICPNESPHEGDVIEQPGIPDTKALEQAHAKISELHESFMRAQAETENVRRRTQDDVAKAHKFAIESFAKHLLPVVDSLEAALADITGDFEKVREGVELTLRQLSSALEKGRVVQINPIGETFDPHQHQAISLIPTEQAPNTIVSVLQKGYVIADRVLRPALVTVAAPEATSRY